MADISYNVSIKVDKDFLSNSVSVSNVTANMTEVGMNSMTLALSTNATTINTANLSRVGVGFFRNLNTATAATVSIGIIAGGSFGAFSTLRPGEPAIYRLAEGVTYGAVGPAGSRLRVDITEG
jgi:hypothetical protein